MKINFSKNHYNLFFPYYSTLNIILHIESFYFYHYIYLYIIYYFTLHFFNANPRRIATYLFIKIFLKYSLCTTFLYYARYLLIHIAYK